MKYLYPTCRITAEEFNRRHWEDGESLSSIARSIDINSSALHYHILKNGLKTRNPEQSYQHRLERHGEYRHRYTLNQHFFDAWSPEMAWVLGLIAADGNIRKNGAQLTFASKDIDVIHKVRDLLEYTGPIQSNNTGIPILVISRVMVCRKLIELGIVPAKSKILQFPSVPESLERHFIRGFFDGDGHISVIPPTKTRISDHLRIGFTTVSQDFALSLSQVLDSYELKHSIRHRFPTGNRNRRWDLQAGGYNAFRFCEFIYHDVSHDLCMERKRKAFEAFKVNNSHLYKKYHQAPPIAMPH